MAQVNSSPGQNQTFGNATVTSSRSQPGSSDQELKSIATVVTYGQHEPGRHGDPALNPIRS